ncbi:heterokaryon incompatibility, partial [Ophiobolus disseminans]
EEERIFAYDALSYTWGSIVNMKHITCNCQRLEVTENLFDALSVLRHRYIDRYLWVDAICINQNDAKERAQQVQKMLMIYQNATNVIAWLGKAHKNTLDALVAASAVAVPRSSGPRYRTVFSGLQNLYTRAWFKRIWVQQEIYAAK